MTSSLPDRNTIRRYLLDTLSPRRRAALEARMQEDDGLRRAVEQEREALARLDLLPEAEPPAGLADATLRRLQEASRR